VAASVLVHVDGGHLFFFPAGEDEGVFLADTIAGDLEDLTADECCLAGVREIDAFRAGDPAGPPFDPAAAVFLRDVLRGFLRPRPVPPPRRLPARIAPWAVFLAGCAGRGHLPACLAGLKCPRLQYAHFRQRGHQDLTGRRQNATMTQDGLLLGLIFCVVTNITQERRRPSSKNLEM
jgi:hypothetical protein